MKQKEIMDIKMEMFDKADCPLCQKDAAINTDVGRGREFLKK